MTNADAESPLEVTLRGPLAAVFESEMGVEALDRIMAARDDPRVELDEEEAGVLRTLRDLEAAEPELDPFAGPRRPARWPVLAAAAGILVALGWWASRAPDPSAGDPLRIMGAGFRLHVVADGPEGPRPVGDAPLPAGTALGLGYTAEAPGHLAVFGVDGREAVALHPLPGGGTRVEPGRRQNLPAGAELTAGDGCEWVVAVFSEAPVDVAAWGDRVAAAGDPDASDGCELGPLEEAGVTVDAVRLPR